MEYPSLNSPSDADRSGASPAGGGIIGAASIPKYETSGGADAGAGVDVADDGSPTYMTNNIFLMEPTMSFRDKVLKYNLRFSTPRLVVLF